MRLVTNGFEFASVPGNSIVSLSPAISISTSAPRQTSLGTGGSRHLIISTGSEVNCQFATLPYAQKETYFKVSQRANGLYTLLEYRFFNEDTEVFRVTSENGNPFKLYVGDVLVETGFLNPTFYSWQSIDIYSNLDSTGTIEVKIDGFTDISYSGDTTTGSSSWNKFDFNVTGRVYFDDLIINNTYTVLKYHSGNEVIPEGNITDGTSTAEIIYHVGDGIEGFMVISNTGTQFPSGASLSADGSAFTGTSNGAEETKNISYPSNTSFIQLLFPNDNGTTSGLQGSDGNSVDNYALVADNENTINGVVSATAGLYDTYQFPNLPSEVTDVNYLESCFYAERDGSSLSSLRSVLRHNSSDHQSHKQTVTSSYTWNKFPYQVNSATDADWTISDVNDLEVGPGVEE